MISKNRTLFLFTIGFTFFLSGNLLFAQAEASWGINIGGTYNTFRGNDYRDILTYRVGYLVGVRHRKTLGQNLILDLSLNYEQKRYDLETLITLGETQIEDNNSNTYHYINLPIVFSVPFGPEDSWFFEMGPYVNFLLGESEEIEIIIPSFRSLDYGLATGIGKMFTLTESSDLMLGIRSELGLVNTAEDENRVPAGIDIRSSSIKLVATWIFAK